ncbi:hypothetical protein F383_28934 [Gossypium arboreum]|uniref:Uncharacterized protein n=1 Tax=Gossypium arboreum TaxID=29729 RepID=A0A0B0MWE4_GOSAR|nr:hypothetical protein F383_28934 [Gossypium arboreum]
MDYDHENLCHQASSGWRLLENASHYQLLFQVLMILNILRL